MGRSTIIIIVVWCVRLSVVVASAVPPWWPVCVVVVVVVCLSVCRRPPCNDSKLIITTLSWLAHHTVHQLFDVETSAINSRMYVEEMCVVSTPTGHDWGEFIVYVNINTAIEVQSRLHQKHRLNSPSLLMDSRTKFTCDTQNPSYCKNHFACASFNC